jgi:hypothetical protein
MPRGRLIFEAGVRLVQARAVWERAHADARRVEAEAVCDLLGSEPVA